MLTWNKIPVLKRETRRYRQIFEQRKRSRYRQLVIDGVFPIFRKIRCQKLALLARDAVGKCHVVRQRNLFVETLFAYRIFALERIDAAHVYRQVRQCQRNGGVLRTLRHQRIHRYAPRTFGETLRVVHTRTRNVFRLLRRIVIVVHVALVVTAVVETVNLFNLMHFKHSPNLLCRLSTHGDYLIETL